jgi:hypothetical protein
MLAAEAEGPTRSAVLAVMEVEAEEEEVILAMVYQGQLILAVAEGGPEDNMEQPVLAGQEL